MEIELAAGIRALPATADRSTWTPEQTALMTSLGLKGVKNQKINGQWQKVEFEAPPSVVQAFLHQARTRRLDPLARQIYCIERGGKWGIEASIDGFRIQAERSKLYRGQTPGYWTDGTRVAVPLRDADGKLERDGQGNPIMVEDYRWVEVWTSDQPPVAARIGVKRSDFDEPLWAVATYDGYCPRDRDGALKPTGQWATNPANQLLKCTEMLALRKAFPDELSGMYGAEEMDQAGAPSRQESSSPRPVQASPKAVVAPSRDWAAEAAGIDNLDDLTALANAAQAAGELGLRVGLAGDNDDGPAHTVMDMLRARRSELEAPSQEPLVDVPAQAPRRRQWVREARALTSRDEVRALFLEAKAAGEPEGVLDELGAIGASLPGPVDVEPVTEWATAEPGASEWVEGPDGEFVEQPAGGEQP